MNKKSKIIIAVKKILDFAKKHILLDTIIYILFIIILYFILKLFNMQYRIWIYYVSFMIFIIGSTVGIVQLYKQKGAIFKKIIIALTSVSVLFLLLSWQYILLLVAFAYTPEHIVIKDNKKYVAHVHSFLDTKVNYFEYINVFFMGDKARIIEDYYNVGRDVLDKEVEGKFTPSDIEYYDEEGKSITKKDKINYDETEKISNETSTPQLDNEKVTSWEFDNVKIKIVNNGSWSGKDILTIEKSTNGGVTYEIQNDAGFDAHYGWSAVFISPDIGYIKDPGIPGNGENSGLYMTKDGGKTFELVDENYLLQREIESILE